MWRPHRRRSPQARPSEGGAFAALRYPTYRRIFIAFLLSHTGTWMQITARAVLVFAITGSASALELVAEEPEDGRRKSY